jgi:2-dehydropantoate 2-reductase
MRIAIIGPGAVGSLFGALLTEGGHQVVLVDRDPARAQGISSNGISLRGASGDRTVRVMATTDTREYSGIDLILLCVKAHATVEALAMHRALIKPSTLVWSIQNGIGNLETIARVIDDRMLLGGVTTQAAYFDEDGGLVHAADGPTLIGEQAGGSSARVEAIVAVLSRPGLQIRPSPDIRREIWHKFFVNVGINAVAAIRGVPNGALLEDPQAGKLLEAAVAEAVKFAGIKGYEFVIAEETARALEVARQTAKNFNSMLEDLRHGRRTEIEALNGAVPGPVNESLTQQIQFLQDAKE